MSGAGTEMLSPAEAVARSGFSLDTLRYYEKIGLLDAVQRDRTGRRLFSEHDLAWLGMLRCLRDTGMPIAGMLRFTELARSGDLTVAERLAVLEEHDARVEEQIAHLRRQQGRIRAKIGHYRAVLTDPRPEPAPTAP
ncbi:MerR family transcriptional regulator [Streptomyces sp. BE303]|uniref:MerR family transcriptional regulator n=1 Tax=Streptomycetaceae TaxID=2062 RepID=UPI002E7767B0|nr:MerR family transcriptional regulator [Streptomyces sp. BE303]MED7950774.1 MerR family transcriptional regulator [Streptomyces sp. BE303]